MGKSTKHKNQSTSPVSSHRPTVTARLTDMITGQSQ